MSIIDKEILIILQNEKYYPWTERIWTLSFNCMYELLPIESTYIRIWISWTRNHMLPEESVAKVSCRNCSDKWISTVLRITLLGFTFLTLVSEDSSLKFDLPISVSEWSILLYISIAYVSAVISWYAYYITVINLLSYNIGSLLVAWVGVSILEKKEIAILGNFNLNLESDFFQLNVNK